MFEKRGGVGWIPWLDRGNFRLIGVTLATFEMQPTAPSFLDCTQKWFMMVKLYLEREQDGKNEFLLDSRHLIH